MKRAIFFDRDGVLNEAVLSNGKPLPPRSMASLKIAAGAREAVARAHEAGYLAIGITNQPDVARGIATREHIEAINTAVARRVGLDALYVCYHDDADDCDCRKPRPGMLLRAARDHGIDLHRSVLVGDRWKDVVCGRTAGCATIFIDRGYAETSAALSSSGGNEGEASAVVHSLEEAIDRVLLGDLPAPPNVLPKLERVR